eukprot:gene17029-18743_t
MSRASTENQVSSSSDKNSMKYDRQLRLWGDHGQRALENAKVCLINGTAVGVETLKSLILPGIGKFVIVDNEMVKEEDLGNNFFLEQDCLGKPRAHCTCKLLQELNDDVIGSSFVEDPSELVENDPEFYKQFTVVIASGVKESDLVKLSDLLWRANIPLLICSSVGFLGYIRLVVKEHTVVEAHPDNSHDDLRLDKPFPGLIQYMNAMDLDNMNHQDHAHTPYLVIIYKFLEKWKQEHAGLPPKNFKEKKELKSMIAAGVMKNENGIEELEENFEEAIKNVNNVLVPTKVPSNIEEIFNSRRCEHPSEPNMNFWIIARAVKEFLNSTGCLPLRGSIPDMFSDSARYIQLQSVYKNQAAKDAASVCEIVQQCLIDMQLEEDLISENEIKTFCKNVHFLHVTHGHPLVDEIRYHNEGDCSNIAELIGDDEDSPGMLYLILRGVNAFKELKKRMPGVIDEELEEDFAQLKAILKDTAEALHVQVYVKDELVKEMCRCGASELHTIAAFIGGIAAQEAIKVITKQFVPMTNTFIYNAITETSLTLSNS